VEIDDPITSDQHVISRFHRGWAVTRTLARRATRIFPTQREAIQFARAIARKEKSTLFVHKDTGSVRWFHDYGDGLKWRSPEQ